MSFMKVLIEDNIELAASVSNYPEKEGYICEISYPSRDAQDKLLSFQYDCILLDITLPDGNGLQLPELIQAEKTESSVLIMSAKNALDDKIYGLESGADDCLTKLFHLPELHAYHQNYFRRNYLYFKVASK